MFLLLSIDRKKDNFPVGFVVLFPYTQMVKQPMHFILLFAVKTAA